MQFVLYTAPWCPSCPEAKSRVEQAASRQGIAYRIKSLDGVSCEGDPIAQTVCSLPTLVAMDEAGKEMGRVMSLQTITDYQDFFRSMG